MNTKIYSIGDTVWIFNAQEWFITGAIVTKVNTNENPENITCDIYLLNGGNITLRDINNTFLFSSYEECLQNAAQLLAKRIENNTLSMKNSSPHAMRKGDIDPLNELIKDYLIGKENLTGIQIGSYAGESTVMFIESNSFRRLYTVDPWEENYDPNDISGDSDILLAEKVFDAKFKYNPIIEKIKAKSTDVADRFEDESIDFIYIDGNHQYEMVKQDLENYVPKIKKGGIIAGHDYGGHKHTEGTKQAINEFFGKEPEKVYEDCSWVYIKEQIENIKI